MPSKLQNKRILTTAIALCLAGTIIGCDSTATDKFDTSAKNLGDYLNLRNSFLDPSQVGRFDKASPWGMFGAAKPGDLADFGSVGRGGRAGGAQIGSILRTDPLPGDIVVTRKEYTVEAKGIEVRISVYELVTPGNEYFKEVQVNELGTINIQTIGVVHVAGLTPTQIEEKVGQIAVEPRRALGQGEWK